ncbi:unnamed protein product [Brassica napus]|uniref:(rape) hypothetical protein n=1 Tax=Brassica napus TaxID=3708 RepID=A0A816LPZ4_BRANA|nr:unnamed protein product [Brassica napus]
MKNNLKKKGKLLSIAKDCEVEVSLQEDGFKGSWFRAILEQNPTRVKGKKASGLLQNFPVPPECLNEGVVFKEGSVVDAYFNNGWWTCLIVVERPDGSFLVYFDDPPDIMRFIRSQLRPHADWIGFEWVKSKNMVLFSLYLRTGKLVEMTREISERKHLIVDICKIRPSPPRDLCAQYSLSDYVEVVVTHGWRKGRVTEILFENKYKVYFAATKEDAIFNYTEIRLSMEWLGGGSWIKAHEREFENNAATPIRPAQESPSNAFVLESDEDDMVSDDATEIKSSRESHSNTSFLEATETETQNHELVDPVDGVELPLPQESDDIMDDVATPIIDPQEIPQALNHIYNWALNIDNKFWALKIKPSKLRVKRRDLSSSSSVRVCSDTNLQPHLFICFYIPPFSISLITKIYFSLVVFNYHRFLLTPVMLLRLWPLGETMSKSNDKIALPKRISETGTKGVVLKRINKRSNLKLVGKKGLWFSFGEQLMRFSLREFHLATDLPCVVDKDEEERLRLGATILVEGILMASNPLRKEVESFTYKKDDEIQFPLCLHWKETKSLSIEEVDVKCILGDPELHSDLVEEVDCLLNIRGETVNETEKSKETEAATKTKGKKNGVRPSREVDHQEEDDTERKRNKKSMWTTVIKRVKIQKPMKDRHKRKRNNNKRMTHNENPKTNEDGEVNEDESKKHVKGTKKRGRVPKGMKKGVTTPREVQQQVEDDAEVDVGAKEIENPETNEGMKKGATPPREVQQQVEDDAEVDVSAKEIENPETTEDGEVNEDASKKPVKGTKKRGRGTKVNISQRIMVYKMFFMIIISDLQKPLLNSKLLSCFFGMKKGVTPPREVQQQVKDDAEVDVKESKNPKTNEDGEVNEDASKKHMKFTKKRERVTKEPNVDTSKPKRQKKQEDSAADAIGRVLEDLKKAD